VIGPGERVGFDPEEDRARYFVGDTGITVIAKGRHTLVGKRGEPAHFL
jgi:hypothetical protein